MRKKIIKAKYILTIGLFLFCLCNINAQNNFVKLYGSNDTDYGSDIVQDQNEDFVLTGLISKSHSCFIKLNKYGEVLIEKTLIDSSFNSVGSAIVSLIDGGYAIAGIKHLPENSNEGSHLWLIRTNENGDTLWTQTYNTISSYHGISMAVTADNGFVLSFHQNNQICLMKTDENGNVLWTNYNTPNHDSSVATKSVVVVPDGYVVCGNFLLTPTFYAFVNKYNLNGELIWSKTFYYPDGIEISFLDLIETNDGYLVTGGIIKSENFNVLLIKIDNNGNEIWRKEFIEEHTIERGTSIVKTNDDCFIIACIGSDPIFANCTSSLLKINNIGEKIWLKSIANSYDEVFVKSLKNTKDFGFIMIGSAYENIQNGNLDILVVKLNSEGELIVEEPHKVDLYVFPNPANGLLRIESEIEFDEVKILNNIGQIVATQHYSEKINFAELDISKLTSGVYYLQIKNDKITINNKIIKI